MARISPFQRSIAWLVAGMLSLSAAGGFSRTGAQATRVAPVVPHLHSFAAGQLGQVRFIKKGLTVKVPKKRPAKGKVKQSLFVNYGLITAKSQLASLGFADGSVLHMNQQTSIMLQSSTVTRVNAGMVQQLSRPGADHTIQTSDASASAVGTNFVVSCSGDGVCIFTVVEGAVLVTSSGGQTVLITTGQQTTVAPGAAPTAPITVDTAPTHAWSAALPPAPDTLGVNASLSANGGAIVNASSQRASAAGTWDIRHVIDGDLRTGWQSAQGETHDETITLSVLHNATMPIEGISINPASQGGEDPSNDLKDFEVKTRAGNGAFSTIFTGTAQESTSTQIFLFGSGVLASQIQLVLHTNWGGADGIAITEIEVIAALSDADPPEEPTETPTATPSPTATPTTTPTPAVKVREVFNNLRLTIMSPQGLEKMYSLGGDRCTSGPNDPAPWTVTYTYTVSGQQTAPYTQTLVLPPGTPTAMVLGGQTNQLPNPQGMQIHLEYVPGASGSTMHGIGDVSNPYTPPHQEQQVPIAVVTGRC